MMNSIEQAVNTIKQGGIIAYPTEAVFGLGCNPFNKDAVEKILQLKRRSVDKGLIIIASAWLQIQRLIIPLTKEQLTKVQTTWPGPTTWILPASSQAPKWITGNHDSIAIRLTNHPIAKTICDQCGQPIVSTSANIEGQEPAKTKTQVKQYFPTGIDYIVPGKLGNLSQPTTIRDLRSNQIIR